MIRLDDKLVEFYKELTSKGILYIPPDLYVINTDLYAIQPTAEGHMAVIRRDEPASSEEEISEETNELVKEEDVTHFDEDNNPEQHIGEQVNYEVGDEEELPSPNEGTQSDRMYMNESNIEEVDKPQNRTSDGRFSS